MSADIRLKEPLICPPGMVLYEAVFRRRVICLVRQDGGGWVAWDKEGRASGTTARDAAQNYYDTYLKGSN
ncbi:hypothetical protein [Actinomyces procaprae]|uniref:hypothetical protein n=1 Tax=Actinomyces procaprae TaxID=2560010 RepID=UPI0010A1FEDB|nr:hypothetical protein [Actinomyces procaprae]